MPDGEIPKFRFYKEGEQISPVDPEDLKRRWNIKPWTSEALLAVQSHEADSSAVWRRDGMIRMLTDFNDGQLLAPWRHGEGLDDAVFRVAATFPIRELGRGNYKTAGDEIFGFDPNAFVRRLIEESGISHVWEPIPTRIREFGYSFAGATFKGQEPPNPEHFLRDLQLQWKREANREARDLLWAIWSRFAHLDRLLSQSDAEAFSNLEAFRLAMMLFNDFVADNHDLLHEVESAFRSGDFPPRTVLSELERRAQGRT
jgi:hypothetical protein